MLKNIALAGQWYEKKVIHAPYARGKRKAKRVTIAWGALHEFIFNHIAPSAKLNYVCAFTL
jgi:hypothetical protein